MPATGSDDLTRGENSVVDCHRGHHCTIVGYRDVDPQGHVVRELIQVFDPDQCHRRSSIVRVRTRDGTTEEKKDQAEGEKQPMQDRSYDVLIYRECKTFRLLRLSVEDRLADLLENVLKQLMA